MLPVDVAIVFHLGTSKWWNIPPLPRKATVNTTYPSGTQSSLLPSASFSCTLRCPPTAQAPKLRNMKSKTILRVKHNEENHSEIDLHQIYDNEDSFEYPGPSRSEGSRWTRSHPGKALALHIFSLLQGGRLWAHWCLSSLFCILSISE